MGERSEPTGEERRQLDHVEKELARWLTRYAGNTEVAILVAAMMRVSGKLLRKYPTDVQGELVDASVAFLRGAAVQEEGALPPGFYIPKGIM